jgi:hypothetical protein
VGSKLEKCWHALRRELLGAGDGVSIGGGRSSVGVDGLL